jgi:hypothetical protein
MHIGLWTLKIKYNSKRRGFFTVQGSTVHYLTYYRGWVVQNFLFFQYGPQTFFQQFNPNWRPIDFDFLWKSEIERRETEMKNVPNMDVVL